MGLFSKLFKKDKTAKQPSDYKVKIALLNPQGIGAVEVVFDLDDSKGNTLSFIPGQYINVKLEIDGKSYTRSYSICSEVGAPLAIGVRAVADGKVSNWFNGEAKVGDELVISLPMGNFKMEDAGKTYVAFAAGSGITPILSMAKSVCLSQEGTLKLFYGNKKRENIMFSDALKGLSQEHVEVQHWLSQEQVDGYSYGRLDRENVTQVLKNDLSLLKADGFYICGPEQMILETSEALKTFGVAASKIHCELFTSPTLLKTETTKVSPSFSGVSKVIMILDGEETDFDLETDGATILDEAESHAIDAPYSCRGGVCCTCKAKVLKGEAIMDSNMSLTDKEVAEGYILTCQAHPASEEVIISYDE